MKLLIGIVNNDDANELLNEMTKASFQATKLSTSGGFLKTGNVTFLVGVEEERVEELIDIFRSCCSRRTQMVPTAPPFIGEGFLSAAPVEVTIGGATIFVIDMEKFLKL
jgi:uncharacterized protein YaaQ